MISGYKFSLCCSKTLITDEARYRLPFEPLGDLAHWFVRRELNYIFDFRQNSVAGILQPVKGKA